MAADDPLPADREARALSDQLGELKDLLQALQTGLAPGVQSALRDRSEEVQRLAGELAGRDEAVAALQAELEASRERIAGLERDVERWQDAARRGVEEIGEQARAAAEGFRAEIGQLKGAVASLTGELADAREEIEKGRSRLKKTQAAYEEVTNSRWWRGSALLREPRATWQGWMRQGARLRRRLLKK